MSVWPGKFVIGLTGNIGTGKSVVRKMLEHLGAYGIDADALANRAVAKGSPAYLPVVNTFGRFILGPDEQIDRARLGRLVFSDPEALAQLEAIVHPLVLQAVDILVRRSPHSVVVIEAIKLFESGMAQKCDSVWVTYAPVEQQVARLVKKRGMSEEAARQRIQAQGPQEHKTARAQVVINNDGSFEAAWGQVLNGWNQLFPTIETEPAEAQPAAACEVEVHRARPKEAAEVAALITQLSGGARRVSRDDIMAAFGEKAFLLLRLDGKALGVVGWKVENLVARTDEVYIDQSLAFIDALGAMMGEVERISRELQCEVSLLFLPAAQAAQEAQFHGIGYQQRAVQGLGVRAWEEAAQESMTPGSVMLFKQLRQDRVLRPV
ncbi:MAG: dephospho-CoA kinase [Chloroflexota bacterium]